MVPRSRVEVVSNSLWAHVTTVPSEPLAVNVTVTLGIVSEPPAENRVLPVPNWRYGAGVLPRKLDDVACAVQPGEVVVGQNVIVNGDVVALPPLAGMKETGAAAVALTYVAPGGIG